MILRLLFVLLLVPSLAHAAPRLAFTDLARVPRSGNSDTSRGQTANQHGGFVTVWGTDLGSGQGSSTITVGGVAPAVIYAWGNATPPTCGPANLSNGYQRLQCVVFQVAATTPTGSQNIVVTVNGVASNPMPVTIATTGRILFAGPGGGKFGTYASPYPNANAGMKVMVPNDILYVLNGVDTNVAVQLTAASNGTNNPSSLPIAVVGYPGAIAQLGTSSIEAFFTCSGCGQGMVYAKLALQGNQTAVPAQNNTRVVGNAIQCPVGNSLTGCIHAQWNNIFILGNELFNTGINNAGSFEQGYHVIYISGHRDGIPVDRLQLERFRDVGWNYCHDNRAARCVNIFNASTSGGNANPITDHKVHDNVIVNQEWDAIMLSNGVTGNNWVYNNLMIRGGQTNLGTTGGSTCLNLRSTYPSGTPILSHDPPTIYVFNNSFLSCGDSRASNPSAINFRSETVDYHIWNNIVYQDNGLPYIHATFGEPGADAAKRSKNLWFGAGAPPVWDTSPLNSNPRYVSTTAPYDLRLQRSSPAIAEGTNLTSRGLGLLDLDGVARGSAWHLGAYQQDGPRAKHPDRK